MFSTENGSIIETGAGFAAKVHWQRSSGVHLPLDNVTPEAISSKWDEINNFDKDVSYPTGLNDTMSVIMAQIGANASSTNLGKGKPSNKSSSQLQAQPTNGSGNDTPTFASDAVFAEMAKAIQLDNANVIKVNAVFRYNITNKAGAKKTWTVSLLKKDKEGSVVSGPPAEGSKKPDVTVDVSDEDYVALAQNKTSAQTLYMKGRIKYSGSLPTAMKFDTALKAARAKLAAQNSPKAKL